MKIHSSIDKDFNSKKKLISDDGKIRVKLMQRAKKSHLKNG